MGAFSALNSYSLLKMSSLRIAYGYPSPANQLPTKLGRCFPQKPAATGGSSKCCLSLHAPPQVLRSRSGTFRTSRFVERPVCARSGHSDKDAIDPKRKWAPGSHAPRRTTSSTRTRSVEPRVPRHGVAPPSPRGPGRGPQIWELGEQIAVGSYAVRRQLSICEDGEEVIEHVVRERPAIVRI